jgi:hypothetical protein
MEFMGISVGVLALVCALVLLFGSSGARKILGWGFAFLTLCAIGVGAVAWISSLNEKSTQTTASSIPETVPPAKPVKIIAPLPTGFVLDETPDLADKIRVTGPDKRIFVFSSGTEEAAIKSYMESQYGAFGSPRSECWFKEPGPWCDHR